MVVVGTAVVAADPCWEEPYQVPAASSLPPNLKFLERERGKEKREKEVASRLDLNNDETLTLKTKKEKCCAVSG